VIGDPSVAQTFGFGNRIDSEDLLAIAVQKANSMNGIRKLNDEFMVARRATLNKEDGSDLKSGTKSII